MRQIIANLPSEARFNFHAEFGVVAGRSSDLQAFPFNRSSIVFNQTDFLLTHLPGFLDNQWCLGFRSGSPLRGSSGLSPDSL
jgi:hypothetical protein